MWWLARVARSPGWPVSPDRNMIQAGREVPDIGYYWDLYYCLLSPPGQSEAPPCWSQRSFSWNTNIIILSSSRPRSHSTSPTSSPWCPGPPPRCRRTPRSHISPEVPTPPTLRRNRGVREGFQLGRIAFLWYCSLLMSPIYYWGRSIFLLLTTKLSVRQSVRPSLCTSHTLQFSW